MNNATWANSRGMLGNQTQLSSSPGTCELPSAQPGSVLQDISWATSPHPRNEGNRLGCDPLSQPAFLLSPTSSAGGWTPL